MNWGKRTPENRQWLLEEYRKTYIDIYNGRMTSLQRRSYDMRQVDLLEGFCRLTNQSFDFAVEHISDVAINAANVITGN